MTIDEIKEALDELRSQGMDDDALIGAVYMMFKDGHITAPEMKIILNVMGYDLTDEFMNMSEEEQKDSEFVEEDEDELDESNENNKD